MGAKTRICKSVLIDLSGTIHIGNTLTPLACEALEK